MPIHYLLLIKEKKNLLKVFTGYIHQVDKPWNVITEAVRKEWNKEYQTLVFSFSAIGLARFQTLMSEPQSIWQKLLVLSWL